MGDIFYYYTNDGPIRSRQHIINHVDMILGLTKSERERASQDKIIIMFSREEKKYRLLNSSNKSDSEMAELRKQMIRDSFYATKWEQFIMAEAENSDAIRSDALKNEEDLSDLINCAFQVWVEAEKGWANFIDRTSVAAVFLNWDSPVVDRIVIDRIPSEADTKDLPLALNVRKNLTTKYSLNEAWKVFTDRVCKNEFMKSYLRVAQNGLCPVCKRRLGDSSVIHHVDYDHTCAFCDSDLEWKMPKTRTQPNCELCYEEHREWFMACASRLRLLHGSCHFYIDCL